MKKNIILLFILITICKICNAQGIYDSELSVNIKIRTNRGEVLENKNVTAIFHFTDNSKNLKNCSGFQFSPHGNDYLNLVKGFSSFINTSRWRNVSEENDNSKLCYENYCSFGYIPKFGNSLIESTKELILLKYFNGRNTLMVIGYDSVNTLVITLN